MNRVIFSVLFTACLLAGCAPGPDNNARLVPITELVRGDAPRLIASGLYPNEVVTIHALRTASFQTFEDGLRARQEVGLQAWAQFQANTDGEVHSLDAPLSGSWEGSDFNGLLWSGFPLGHPALSDITPAESLGGAPQAPGILRLVLERDDGQRRSRDITLLHYSDRIHFTSVGVHNAPEDGVVGGISAVLAAPAGAANLPTVILLHGSEGANPDASRRWAGRMAERGFAALALHYVAYPWAGGIDGVEPTLMNIPIETLARAHAFLKERPEADPGRIGVFGISKGAELALVAASRYDWIKAVVACVPSDVVWSGFGRELEPGEGLSSWTWQGASLPAIPYDRYDDVFEGKATATEVHRRSRALLDAEQIEATRIPVEQIDAEIMLISGGLDQTWPSLEMADSIEASRRAAGLADKTTHLRFEGGSHGLCGDGTRPQRVDQLAQQPSKSAETATADGIANSTSFGAIVEFLQRILVSGNSNQHRR